MEENKVDNNKEETIASLNLLDRKIQYKINLISGVIVCLICIPFIFVFYYNNYNSYWLLSVIILLLPGTFLHEGSHYIFQWLFSHKKPYMGFKFPSPFSALSSNASITRNQAIICALAPLFIVSVLIFIPAIFLPFFPRIILLAWASIEIATCSGDIYAVKWLLKNPRDTRLKNVNLVNVLYR